MYLFLSVHLWMNVCDCYFLLVALKANQNSTKLGLRASELCEVVTNRLKLNRLSYSIRRLENFVNTLITIITIWILTLRCCGNFSDVNTFQNRAKNKVTRGRCIANFQYPYPKNCSQKMNKNFSVVIYEKIILFLFLLQLYSAELQS